MPFTSSLCVILVATELTVMAARSPAQGASQSPQGTAASEAPAKGVQCPTDFETVFDPTTKVMRCRRDVVSWVVTNCPDKDFATYSVKTGPDICMRTEIPGVGTPPGSNGSKPVACAAPGYAVVVDRTGLRDRCERLERSFAFPRPVQ